jgi:hypothetical protein
VRWYVRHAERYLKALCGKRLAEHAREVVTGYLRREYEVNEGNRVRSFSHAPLRF